MLDETVLAPKENVYVHWIERLLWLPHQKDPNMDLNAHAHQSSPCQLLDPLVRCAPEYLPREICPIAPLEVVRQIY